MSSSTAGRKPLVKRPKLLQSIETDGMLKHNKGCVFLKRGKKFNGKKGTYIECDNQHFPAFKNLEAILDPMSRIHKNTSYDGNGGFS